MSPEGFLEGVVPVLSFQGQMEQPTAEAISVARLREQCVQRPGGGGGEGEAV